MNAFGKRALVSATLKPRRVYARAPALVLWAAQERSNLPQGPATRVVEARGRCVLCNLEKLYRVPFDRLQASFFQGIVDAIKIARLYRFGTPSRKRASNKHEPEHTA